MMSFKANIDGVDAIVKQLQEMKPKALHKTLKDLQVKAVEPIHNRLLVLIYNIVGKHDNETPERALQHRWRRNKRGRPVKYSRLFMIRQLLKTPITGRSAFGLKWGVFPQNNGSFARVKIWNPGLHLIDRGRGKTRPYVGWNKLGKMLAGEVQGSVLPSFVQRLKISLQAHIYLLNAKQRGTLRRAA
jgi:hypothetical protein